jgi:hypothetical protein
MHPISLFFIFSISEALRFPFDFPSSNSLIEVISLQSLDWQTTRGTTSSPSRGHASNPAKTFETFADVHGSGCIRRYIDETSSMAIFFLSSRYRSPARPFTRNDDEQNHLSVKVLLSPLGAPQMSGEWLDGVSISNFQCASIVVHSIIFGMFNIPDTTNRPLSRAAAVARLSLFSLMAKHSFLQLFQT